MLYIISYFLHLPSRLPFLGFIRFDLILAVLIIVLIIFGQQEKKSFQIDFMGKCLICLFVYFLISLPFVKWPGSVLHTGFENFFKAVVFFVFTAMTVADERKLRCLVLVFVGCQLFRVVEPVYLHLTTGYWGDSAFMGADEMMNRLAGAPHDIINPNGLAYVIVTVIPFWHYLIFSSSRIMKLSYFPVLALCGFALILTGSRSGFVAAMAIFVIFFLKTRRKIIFMIAMVLLGLVFIVNLSEMQRDRYLSIYRDDVRGASTAEGRIEGLYKNIELALKGPLMGYGLGTSSEAGYNLMREELKAHNLYLEIWEEIGIIGLIIFLVFMVSIILGYRKLRASVKRPEKKFFNAVTDALSVWLVVNLVFSLVSYGLSSYPWYFMGGLVTAISMILHQKPAVSQILKAT